MAGGGYGGNYGGNEPVDTCVADVSGTRPGERGQKGKYSWPETPLLFLLVQVIVDSTIIIMTNQSIKFKYKQ